MTWQWVVVILGIAGLISFFLSFGLWLTRGEKMAEPKTEIDRRFDRIELAIRTMSLWLVQAQAGFSTRDVEGIERILRGEKSQKVAEDTARTEAHRRWEEEDAGPEK